MNNKIFLGNLLTASLIVASTLQASEQSTRFAHTCYQKGQLVCIIKDNDSYSIAKKINCCNCCDNAMLYVVDHYSELINSDGTMTKIVTVSRDSDIRIAGFPLYQHRLTLYETIAEGSMKHGPGGPRAEESIRPHNGGTAIATILVVGIGGIIYKMLKKIKELQEQTKPTNA